MKTEQIKKLTHQQLKKLAQSIEQEKGPNFQKLLDTMANFPQYSERNALLIALQCPQATQVAGFYAWIKQGRFVKKGEKAIRIFAPIANRKQEQALEQEEDNRPKRFKAAYVFDISQTKLFEETQEACAA